MERRTPLWLSHHWPEDYHRCARVGRRHLCRRCLVVYPVWLVASVLAVAGLRWPEPWDAWVVWLLPLPAAIEWWMEHLGRLDYSPRRNVTVSVLAAVGVGVAFARYLERPTDPLFWTVVLTYGIACVVGALWGSHRGRGTAPTASDPPAGSAGISSSAEPSGTVAGRAR